MNIIRIAARVVVPRAGAAALGAFALAAGTACDKVGPQQLTATAPAARVKFYNYGVNAPGVNFYANDTKMTAIGSATGSESVLGTAYGATAAGGFYTTIAAGQYTFTGRIAAATDNGLPVASVPVTVADGRAYSLYVSGLYNTTTKKADAFFVEDALPDSVPDALAAVRVVNAIYNSAPLILYAKNTTSGVETALGAAVAYKSAGAFVSLPLGAYDLSVRTAGSSTSVATLAASSFGAGRVYTVSARGDVTVTGTTAANRPQLDNTANR